MGMCQLSLNIREQVRCEIAPLFFSVLSAGYPFPFLHLHPGSIATLEPLAHLLEGDRIDLTSRIPLAQYL
jgi:hypothetical protein